MSAALALSPVAAAPLLGTSDTIIGGEVTLVTFSPGIEGTSINTNNWPGAEGPSNVLDGSSSTKYLNFFGANSGLIVTPSIGASIATGLTLVTASSLGEEFRRPASYVLMGSNSTGVDLYDLANYTALTSGSTVAEFGSGSPDGAISATYNFSNTLGFTSYLLYFPTLNPGNYTLPGYEDGQLKMQIGDVQLNGTAVPEPSGFALCLTGFLGSILFFRRLRFR